MNRYQNPFEELERIAGQDIGKRGMQHLVEFGELKAACSDLMQAKVFFLTLEVLWIAQNAEG